LGEQRASDRRGNDPGVATIVVTNDSDRRCGVGLFRASREELEEQAERDRELVKAESESEQRLHIEVAASMLQAQDQARFKSEWCAWLGNLDRLQKESNEVALTPEILATIGDVPQPNTGGLTTRAIANSGVFS